MDITYNDECDPNSFENKFVHKIYDKISDHFSRTRYKPWPKVKEFLTDLSPNSCILDIGSGNGKYLNLRKDIMMVGVDRCNNLNNIVASKGSEVVQGDALSLPFKSNIFDACICIAVLHHISTLERRISAIKEMERITNKGGLILLQVWAFEQESLHNDMNYNVDLQKDNLSFEKSSILKQSSGISTDVKEKLPSSLLIHKNRTQFQGKDILVPWNFRSKNALPDTISQLKNPEIYYRFYHVFKHNEVNHLLEHIPKLKLIKSYYDKGNWAYILQKL